MELELTEVTIQRALDHYLERIGLLYQDEEIKPILTSQIKRLIEKCKVDFEETAKVPKNIAKVVLNQYLVDLGRLHENMGKQFQGYEWKAIENEKNDLQAKLSRQ